MDVPMFFRCPARDELRCRGDLLDAGWREPNLAFDVTCTCT